MSTKSLLEMFRVRSGLFRLEGVRRGLLTISLSILFTLISASSFAFNMDMTHSPGGQGLSGPFTTYDLSWETVPPSTTVAVVSYYVYEQFGVSPSNAFQFQGHIFNSAGFTNLITTNAVRSTFETSAAINDGTGSRCFVVVSSDSFTGAINFSNYRCHNFLHHLDGEGIVRADGDGTQRGIDQQWDFTYSLDTDAQVTATIYPPGTTFTTNEFGYIVSAGSPIVKTLISSTPRSGELADHNITMVERWDSRSSSGVVVPNGIYLLLLQAELDSGQFNGTLPFVNTATTTRESLLRYGFRWSVPVDILRIIDLTATGITLSNPSSAITYTLTGDALVRMVVAQPGSGFGIDGNGDIQPRNLTNGTFPDSSLIVSTFAFQRKAGVNTEAWDGTSSTGAVMDSGVYQVGLSARDDFGNFAVDNTGNDFPIFTTITLERSAGSDDGTTTLTDSTPPTLVSVSPSSGAALSSTVSTITVVLADADSALNLSGGNITILDPNSSTVSRTLTSSGTDTLIATFATPLDTNGTYTVTIDGVDTAGNSATFTTSFSIFIGLAATDFENNLRIFPNPAKNTATNIEFDLSVDSTVEIDIFNILGEKVREFRRSDSAGTDVTQQWDLRNTSGKRVGSGLYLVRIKATGGGISVETTQKLVVIQ